MRISAVLLGVFLILSTPGLAQDKPFSSNVGKAEVWLPLDSFYGYYGKPSTSKAKMQLTVSWKLNERTNCFDTHFGIFSQETLPVNFSVFGRLCPQVYSEIRSYDETRSWMGVEAFNKVILYNDFFREILNHGKRQNYIFPDDRTFWLNFTDLANALNERTKEGHNFFIMLSAFLFSAPSEETVFGAQQEIYGVYKSRYRSLAERGVKEVLFSNSANTSQIRFSDPPDVLALNFASPK